jgi:tetratricopeptide (TPR) repeat protein
MFISNSVKFSCRIHVLLLLALTAGCASTSRKTKDRASAAGASEKVTGGQQRQAQTKAQQTEAAEPASQSKQTSAGFTMTTLSNEESFAGRIPQPKLEDLLRDLEQAVRERNDDGGAIISYLVFRRLSGTSRDFASVLERRGSTASSKDPWILIECAYTALLQRNYGMVQYLLDTAETVGKGKPKVASAVLHARGLMFYNQKKIVQAMASFRDAAQQGYEPAVLTLTLFALKAGDHEGANGYLGRLKDAGTGNLNVRAALGIASRLAGKPEEAVEHLRAVQRARPNDRRLVWNLALALGQLPAKRKEAISLLERYNDLPGANVDIDARARALLDKLQNQEEAARAEAAKGKAAPAGAAEGSK